MKIDLVRESDTALAGESVTGVLGTVALDDHMGFLVNLDGELDAEDSVDGANGGQVLFGDSADLGSLRERERERERESVRVYCPDQKQYEQQRIVNKVEHLADTRDRGASIHSP